MGAIQFIENLDRTALTVSDAEFERHVEVAVSAIAERYKDEHSSTNNLAPFSEKSSLSRPEVTPRNSMEAERYPIRRSADGNDDSELVEEHAAVTGLLRTIKRPLTSIGRIFSEELTSPQFLGDTREQQISAYPPETPRRLSPGVFQPPRNSSDGKSSYEEPPRSARSPKLTAEDAAARQASVEAAEAQRIQRAEQQDVVE